MEKFPKLAGYKMQSLMQKVRLLQNEYSFLSKPEEFKIPIATK
jgi:hypothetical protein